MALHSGISPRSDLKLGSHGNIDGHSVTLKGYIRSVAHDDEDIWYWEEWYCGTHDGHELWIEYDEETKEYSLHKKFPNVQVTSKEPWTAGQTITLSDSDKFHVFEQAEASIIESEGELPEGHTIGTNFVYWESSPSQKNFYSVESSDEIEVFKGKFIAATELFAALGLNSGLAKANWRTKQKKMWEYGRVMSFLVCAICVVGLVFSLASGKKIFTSNFRTCDVVVQTNCITSETLLGPVTLDKVNRGYKISISSVGGITQQNWQAVTVTLLDKDKQPISAVHGDFWEERWVEGNESGIESNLEDSKMFRLTQAGEYYLQVKATPVNAVSNSISLKLDVFEGVWFWQYFMGLLTGGVSLVGLKDKWYLKLLDS